MKNKIIILGSGTCNNEKEKANSSILIQINGTNIIYDFGYKIYYRLKELNFSQDDISHIIISHFHPDHFCDLIPYIHSGLYSLNDKRYKRLNIYSNKHIHHFGHIIKKLLLNPPEFEEIINLYSIEDRDEIKINGLKINFRILNHFDNVAIKFFINDKIISITGDLEFEKDDLKFFSNSDYCFFYSGKLKEKDIIYFKKHYLIKSLIILHSYIDLNKAYLLNENIILGEDFMEILI